MPSCRDIKKDINFLASQMMAECFSFLEYSPVNNHENVIDILHDVIQLRANLIYKVNHPPQNGILKNYYKEIVNEMYDQNLELIERLNSLSAIE